MATNSDTNPSSERTRGVVGQSEFSAPNFKFWRTGAVRIVLPGLNEPGHQLEPDYAFPVTNLAIDLLAEQPSLSEIELLSYTGTQGQEHLITPKLRAERPETRNSEIQTALQSFEDVAEQTQNNSVTNQIAASAAEYLPSELGIERCSVDFAPLGISPVTTSRLVLKKNRETVVKNFMKYNPGVWTVRELVRSGKPHMIQTLIRRGPNNNYLVSYRCAVFDPAHAITTDEDFLTHMEHGVNYDLSAIWEQCGLKSNFDVPINDFYRTLMGRPVPKQRNYMELSDSRGVREIFEGNTEFVELLQGRSGYDELYQKVLGYPRIPVTEAGLRFFTPIVPLYYDNPWDAAPGRRPPVIDTNQVVREAGGTDQALGTDSDAIIEPTTATVANEGSIDHKALVAFTIQYYTEQGYEAYEVDQNSDSLPDAQLVQDGDTVAVEIEASNKSKPANVLTNKARAHTEDTPVMFVTSAGEHGNPNQAAGTIKDKLITPYARKHDDGVELYNWTEPVVLPDGSRPVLPQPESESIWILDHDGRLRLGDPNATLAEGPADESISSFEFTTPRYVPGTDDESHRILDDNDSVIAQAQTKSGLLNEWTQVRIPHVPVDLHYLDDSEVMYKSGNELTTLDRHPAWDRDATGKRNRYQGALSEFLRRYTIEIDDEELQYDAVFNRFETWFNLLSTHPAPGKKEFGVALPDAIETKRRQDGDEWNRYVKDRTWIFPTGIHSPDLPFSTASSD